MFHTKEMNDAAPANERAPQAFLSAQEKQDIKEADFGRKFGWRVEFQGVCVATLQYLRWDSHAQYWHEYKINAVSENPELFTESFWQQDPALYKFVNQKYPAAKTSMLPLFGTRKLKDRILTVRGLFLEMD